MQSIRDSWPIQEVDVNLGQESPMAQAGKLALANHASENLAGWVEKRAWASGILYRLY